MNEELKALREEIAALRREVEAMRAGASIPTYYSPPLVPYLPYIPGITAPATCSGGAGSLK